ncbi:MAG TPA: alpha/beta hydrolase [Acidimicrobiales bacterium]|nr:alpha/beta hydrolase [Acidimicrobiales bacterium]
MNTLVEGTITANGVEFGYLAAGAEDAPLALCFHGFPDTAHTYRHLLPRLAEAGFRGVAPFLRGYAPTQVPADGLYQTGALVRDANELWTALGGDERAVVIGHDWGANAAYGTAVMHPERWAKCVAMAVPVGPALASQFFSYDQIKKSFYMYFFQGPVADFIVAANDLEFIARLWDDWSPGYDATEDMEHVRKALGTQENLAAALGYYRATFNPQQQSASLSAEQGATGAVPTQPTLYLHGAQDGCIGVSMAEAARPLLAEGSRVEVIEGAGHFLQLEKPDEVNDLILDFLVR